MKRREFIKTVGIVGAGTFLPWRGIVPSAFAQLPGGTLDPTSIPKYVTPLVISPVTVRTHIDNLSQKLGVHGRRAVVARAREMGLLGPDILGTGHAFDIEIGGTHAGRDHRAGEVAAGRMSIST